MTMDKTLKTYKVEITETLQRIIEVEAASLDDAITEIRRQYQDEEIILDSGDYIDTVISGYKNDQ
jgi:L-lactate utilization protein LutC